MQMNNYSDRPVYLAPLAGMTDCAMRRECIRQGAKLTFTEMVSAKGIKYNSEKTRQLILVCQEESSIGVQLFGSDKDILRDIAKGICDEMGDKIREININMGCPAHKIVGNGEGCALMKDIKKASGIIKNVSQAINVPLTVKFRKGYDDEHINAVEFAKMAQDSGAAMICVHGRTREQFYSGSCDREIIRKVKQTVSIPVIGNGDIFDGQSAYDMFEQTGCDGIMVARGALGNPFIFREIDEFLKTGKCGKTVTPREKIEACLRQAKYAVLQKGEKQGIRQMRKHGAFYLKGIKNSAKVKNAIVLANTYAEFEDILNNFLAQTEK